MLRNCEECNRVFAHATRRLCSECFEEAQKSFTAVKEYLQGNQGATVAEVNQETGVDIEVIYEYIRQGRLNVIPSDVKFHCEICDTEISTGRICSKCRKELQKSAYVAPQEVEKPEKRGSKVHYLDQIKSRRS